MSINREFKLKRTKITHIVTDGASNFQKAFTVYGSDENERETADAVETFDKNNEQIDEEIEVDIEDVLGPECDEIFYPHDVHPVNLQWSSCIEDDDDECDEYGSLPTQLKCVSHKCNLLGKDFRKKLKESSQRCFDIYTNAYKKLKRFWEVNSRSTVAHEIIQDVCKRSFPYPSQTRWNAEFDAIEIAEKHKQSIKIAIDNINHETKQNLPRSTTSKQLETLNSTEWKILKDYIICMRPVAIALDIIQGEKRACAGYILPTLYGIKASLNENIEEKLYVSDYGRTMNETMLICLSNRFGDMMKICDENKNLILAAAIHPNFKLTWLESETDREFAQTLLINSYVELANSKKNCTTAEYGAEIVCSPSENRSKESQFFKRLRTGEKRTSTDSLTFDVWKYAIQSIDDKNLNQIRGIPILEELFRRYNTTLASSAAVERIFSQALIIFTDRRNKISYVNFEKLLFIKQNRDLI